MQSKPGERVPPESYVMMLDPAVATAEGFGAEWPEHPEVPIPYDVIFNGDKSMENPPIPVRAVLGLGFVMVIFRATIPPGLIVGGLNARLTVGGKSVSAISGEVAPSKAVSAKQA